jgi:putative ABC transport system permease protein
VALGADRQHIVTLVLRRGLTLSIAGVALGLGAALWLTRLLQSLLFSVSNTDPVTFIAVPVLVVVISIFACYLPARRAARVDPLVALRCE